MARFFNPGRLLLAAVLGIIAAIGSVTLHGPAPTYAADAGTRAAGAGLTGDAGLAGDWVEGHASRVRLVAGNGEDVAGAPVGSIVAGLEIAMPPGWKTYWRNPGEAGGVPPEFDWSSSKDVAEAKVLYPAPERLADSSGQSIGYKGHAVFPVIVTPADGATHVQLRVNFEFGVCKDICIPAQAELSLDVPLDVSIGLPAELRDGLARVPRGTDDKQPGDPELTDKSIVLTGDDPRILIEADFGNASDANDIFAEAPGGLYLPMTRKVADNGGSSGRVRFGIDLKDTSDLDDLKGKTITLTLVGARGQSERKLVLE